MARLRYFVLWQAVGVVLIAAVIYLSLTPSFPDLMDFTLGDKLAHMSAYFVLMSWHAQIYAKPLPRLLWGIGFIALGIGLEYGQGLGGTRYFDWLDALANGTGVFLAWALARTRVQRLLGSLDHRLAESALR